MIKKIFSLLTLIAIAVSILSGCTVTGRWIHLKPLVIEGNQNTSILIEVKITGNPSSVELELASGTLVQLVDDETQGDQLAGDGVFTSILMSSQIFHDFTTDDVNRNCIGFLRLYENSVLKGQYNIFADILTPDIPTVEITFVANGVQYSENLVNIVDSDFFDTFSITSITQKFYSHFGDLYDYINIIYEYSHFKNRNHLTIRNNVQGIGQSIIDNTSEYGSGGRLLGLTEFPIPTMFDGASPSYSHELGHQWINFVSVAPLDSAVPHWPLSDLATGIMGWGTDRNTQGLSFNFDLVPMGNDYQLIPNYEPKEFSDLSLYLMGFQSPDQVQSHFVFENQDQTPVNGGILLGPVTTIDIDGLINQLGPRSPNHNAAQKKFQVATIIVSKDGLLDRNTMRFYDWFSKRATETNVVPYSDGLMKGETKPFHLATQGVGRIETRIERRILIDSSRDGGVWWFPQAAAFDPNAEHQGKALADYLRSLGYKVMELPRPYSITTELLDDFDIVIRAVGLGSYTTAEINAYIEYLQNGGNILLLADYSPSDELATSLGLNFAGITRGENILSNFGSHDLTQGVGALSYNVGSSLISYPSHAQIIGRVSSATYTDLDNNGEHDSGEPAGSPVLGVMSVGHGRIVFCGDANLWERVPLPLLDNLLNWF